MFETDDGVSINTFHLRDVVGRIITCDDGVRRKVEQISYSHRYPTRVLINEVNEDETFGGAWVHTLSLSCQMHGDPLPTKEQRDAFDRAMEAFRFEPEQEKGGYTTLPSGIVIKR